MREANGELGLGERNGWRREDGADTTGMGLDRLDTTWTEEDGRMSAG